MLQAGVEKWKQIVEEKIIQVTEFNEILVSLTKLIYKLSRLSWILDIWAISTPKYIGHCYGRSLEMDWHKIEYCWLHERPEH